MEDQKASKKEIAWGYVQLHLGKKDEPETPETQAIVKVNNVVNLLFGK